MRVEEDNIGKVKIPDDLPVGINTMRAVENFPSSGERINPFLIRAYLWVKKAAAITNYKCKNLSKEKFSAIISAIDLLIEEVNAFIEKKNNSIYGKIITDPLQGGAGTSLNMNVNEVIANTALKLSGHNYGEYQFIHPLDDVNKSQSTNDTYITAVKVASLELLKELQNGFAVLQNSLQKKEKEFSGIIKLGRTQLQDAVPMTLGSEFGAYAQAIARDRWRIYNAEERLRSVNLGGTAIGTSVAASRKYVLNVVKELRAITSLPIAKAEDLIEATQNLDVFVEVHGIVKAGATSVIKICNDLRFLSSGPGGGLGEIILPKMQAGSTIMPGKINPVILENTIQICELVKGHDSIITNLVAAGNLELNQFAPMIAHLFLKTLQLLTSALNNLSVKCIDGIKANEERCRQNLLNSTAIAAAFINEFGYEKITSIVNISESKGVNFIDELKNILMLEDAQVYEILKKELGINNVVSS